MSLASNQLENLKPFSMLPSYVPKLTALSFQENLLRSLRDLEPLRGADLTVLRELLLTGNPLRDKELAKPGGDVVYRSDIKKLFPSIEVLDMEPVVGDITFAVDAMSMELPLSTKPGFFDSPATAAIVHDFLQTFLNLFDNNRSGLFDLYHDHSSFSVSLDTRPASTTRSSHPSSRDGPLFSAWKNFDHNLEKHKIPDKRISALAKGGANIINMFNQLPGLRHPAYPGPQYLVEGYQTGTGADLTLIVLVHGEFREVSSNTNGSFDRTFIIVAPAPGSRAAMAGMPYSVANDQLTVRSFAGNKAWAQLKDEASARMSNAAPQASARPPQLPDLTVLKQLQLHHQLDDARQNQVIEFSTATGLNYQFSLQCLAETGWSAPAAMQAYHNVKGNIPPEAYQLG
ncbi:hypothetical protein PhCBS80983_g05475 [Powellomyces hirtus]|uniref:NTF2 domain-containing protein n=1 Tax=Powellomyces hirtus TaxID=109895 RepID=A0A507DU19_9FUNG|nr:hypothetical protein PhCBS80983_g05475 [Powellomyces hirtus]